MAMYSSEIPLSKCEDGLRGLTAVGVNRLMTQNLTGTERSHKIFSAVFTPILPRLGQLTTISGTV